MRAIAVLSDIHGNLEALDAVLADAAARRADTIYCLGDLVGYGPNPLECIDRARNWDVVLLGNHDQATLFVPDGFGQSAENAVLWTRTLLQSQGVDRAACERRWAFLADRRPSFLDDDILFVHGSPRNPLHEYVFPEDIYHASKMRKIAAHFDHYCFNGHTHVPGVFVADSPEVWQCHHPTEIGEFWRLDGRKTIVNVGSVGQPRDGDWRACYALLDGWDVTFRRVEYDVDAAVRKIYAVPELEDFLGDRLREGR